MNFTELFTPIFIFIALAIFICGIIGIQFLDRLFAGSTNLNAIRMFALTILINIIILLFILMSFSKVKFSTGAVGPQGNVGARGPDGKNGGLTVCEPKYEMAEDKKAREISNDYLDLKLPVLDLE